MGIVLEEKRSIVKTKQCGGHIKFCVNGKRGYVQVCKA